MNLVHTFVLLFLVCGAAAGLFAAAASQSSTPFIDTAGNAPTAQSNQTQNQTFTAAPPVLSGLVIGIVLILSSFTIFIAAMLVWKPGSRTRGRR